MGAEEQDRELAAACAAVRLAARLCAVRAGCPWRVRVEMGCA